MAGGVLTKEEMNVLNENPYVLRVSKTQVLYSEEFKRLFLKEYFEGKRPTQIFRECGFDPKVLGGKRIERATYNWKKAYNSGEIELE